MSSSEFDDLNEEMLGRFFSINPDSATMFGMHDPYDGQLPHGGVRRLEDTLSIVNHWEKRASEIAKDSELSEDQTTSLEVLRMCVRLLDFALNDYQEWQMFPEACETPGMILFLMLSREYAPFEKRASWISSRIGQLPRFLTEYRTRYRPGRPVRSWTKNAIITCRGFPSFLTFIEEHSRDKIPPALSAELARNVADANQALAEHLRWLERLLDKATDDFSMGRRNLEKLLKIRGFTLTSDEILNLAKAGLKEMKEERAFAAMRISPADPAKAIRIIRDDWAGTFDLALEETRNEMAKAKKWIVDKGICTLDYKGDVQVIETPAFMRTGVTTAALMMPAVFDEEAQGIYLITRPDSIEDVKQECNRSAIVNTTVHEAYPGHYHQGAMSFKKPWMHQLHHMTMTTDTMVSAYETMEGWAHYCEKMMFEKGYAANDKAYYVMLDYAIWRACRVVHDVNLCRGDATVEQMLEFFMKETDSSREIAEGDVIGFSRTPSYALSYFIGRHLVLQLKDDLTRELGPKFDEMKFHDLLAINGNLPFHLAERAVRAGMGASVR